MNDMYEKGYQDGYENGHKDGFAKGWHEARRIKQLGLTGNCPKCKREFDGSMIVSCSSWACPMLAQSTSGV
jgi:flagellar biosynthesis/type III secretory pathway protein FliH